MNPFGHNLSGGNHHFAPEKPSFIPLMTASQQHLRLLSVIANYSSPLNSFIAPPLHPLAVLNQKRGFVPVNIQNSNQTQLLRLMYRQQILNLNPLQNTLQNLQFPRQKPDACLNVEPKLNQEETQDNATEESFKQDTLTQDNSEKTESHGEEDSSQEVKRRVLAPKKVSKSKKM